MAIGKQLPRPRYSTSRASAMRAAMRWIVVALGQDLGGGGRHFQQRVGQFGFAFRGIDGAARAGEGQRQAGQHRELRGEGLGAGHADFRPGDGSSTASLSRAMLLSGTFSIDRTCWPRSRMLRSAASVSAVSPDWLTSRPRPPPPHRRFAVAEFAGHVGIGRECARSIRTTSARPGRRNRREPQAVMVMREFSRGSNGRFGQRHQARAGIDHAVQRVADHRRVLVQLLFHEMAVIALADRGAGQRGQADLALHFACPRYRRIRAPSRLSTAQSPSCR
jgi:hypothetical protein